MTSRVSAREPDHAATARQLLRSARHAALAYADPAGGPAISRIAFGLAPASCRCR